MIFLDRVKIVNTIVNFNGCIIILRLLPSICVEVSSVVILFIACGDVLAITKGL